MHTHLFSTCTGILDPSNPSFYIPFFSDSLFLAGHASEAKMPEGGPRGVLLRLVLSSSRLDGCPAIIAQNDALWSDMLRGHIVLLEYRHHWDALSKRYLISVTDQPSIAMASCLLLHPRYSVFRQHSWPEFQSVFLFAGAKAGSSCHGCRGHVRDGEGVYARTG